MQFVVPQFIEVESKIIGPISARQFIIVVITLGISFIWYQFFSLIVFVPLLFITCSFGGALAFLKVNGQSMHYFLLNLTQTLKRPRLKVWMRSEYAEQKDRVVTSVIEAPMEKEVTDSHLAAMSLMVDTGGAYQGEESTKTTAVVSPVSSSSTTASSESSSASSSMNLEKTKK